MSDAPQIEVNVKANALTVPMTVRPQALILQQPAGELSLEGPKGFFLKVPAEAFGFLRPGQQVVVTLGIILHEIGTVAPPQVLDLRAN